jgi:hypothetical protein
MLAAAEEITGIAPRMEEFVNKGEGAASIKAIPTTPTCGPRFRKPP